MNKLKINEVIIVEGKYDKIRIEPLVDATIITTDGFGVFKDKQKQLLIRRLADERGILILTDSDGAGFVIRNFLSGCVPPEKIKHAYIPKRIGKERRKDTASKEGILGVEGMDTEVLLRAFEQAGVTAQGCNAHSKEKEPITRIMLYDDGFLGGNNSSLLRKKLLEYYDLPEHLSTSKLIELLNIFSDANEYKMISQKVLAEFAKSCED